MDYDELVQRLAAPDKHAYWPAVALRHDAADAITQLRAENAQYDATLTAAIEREDALRAERDNAIAECVMHIGNAKALRAERDEWHNVATAAGLRIVDIRAERDDAIRHLADWSSRCGRTETERDALAARHERALIAGAELRKERDAIAALLREVAPIVWAHEDVGSFSERIDAALKDKP